MAGPTPPSPNNPGPSGFGPPADTDTGPGISPLAKSQPLSPADILDASKGHTQERMTYIVQSMREMSRITDPQAMVRYYAERMRPVLKADRMVALSRRAMTAPAFRITRSSQIGYEHDPWKNPDGLPTLTGGLLGELIYGDEPRYIADMQVGASDPGYHFLKGMRSAVAIPQYDGGVSLNMVIHMWDKPHGIDPERLPEVVWNTNLFGRATNNLVLSRQLGEAFMKLDKELRVVGDIQRSLLPMELPRTPGMDWAAHYQTSTNAGGDYYDFFELEPAVPGGPARLGVMIADVSGHGTPAAVLMAVLHAMAHLHPGQPVHPGKVLSFLNQQLCLRYSDGGMFITAFYGVYDPADRSFVFSSAGHNPPRLRVGFAGKGGLSGAGQQPGAAGEGGPVLSLEQAQGLPMGIMTDAEYPEFRVTLGHGDALVMYTDGITEAFNRKRAMFGTERLDEVIERPHASAAAFIGTLLREVEAFADGVPANDDRTVLVAVVG